MMEPLIPYSRTFLPFFPEIRGHEMAKSLKTSKKRYNMTTDPYGHVEEFETYLDAFNAANKAKCKAIPITSEGSAGNWLRSLPAGSITSFEDLQQVFITKFLLS